MSQFYVSYMVKTGVGFEPRSVITPPDSGIVFNSSEDFEEAAMHLSLIEAREAYGSDDLPPDYMTPEIHVMGVTRLPV